MQHRALRERGYYNRLGRAHQPFQPIIAQMVPPMMAGVKGADDKAVVIKNWAHNKRN
jgi:hypothetical protein